MSFEEAKSVLFDDFALQFNDEDAVHEDRFLMLGMSNETRVLVVVHCEPDRRDEEIRIISARKATSRERQ